MYTQLSELSSGQPAFVALHAYLSGGVIRWRAPPRTSNTRKYRLRKGQSTQPSWQISRFCSAQCAEVTTLIPALVRSSVPLFSVSYAGKTAISYSAA
jgi:hypothetical protein